MRELYNRRHRALAAPDERVGPEGVDLVALELGLLQIKGGDDDPAGGVHFQGHSIAPLRWMPKERLEHADYVHEAVFVVIEQDHIVG
jgi:hypothetical protein